MAYCELRHEDTALLKRWKRQENSGIFRTFTSKMEEEKQRKTKFYLYIYNRQNETCNFLKRNEHFVRLYFSV